MVVYDPFAHTPLKQHHNATTTKILSTYHPGDPYMKRSSVWAYTSLASFYVDFVHTGHKSDMAKGVVKYEHTILILSYLFYFIQLLYQPHLITIKII